MGEEKGNRVKFTTSIDENLLIKLKVQAALERRTVVSILEDLIRDYTEKKQPPAEKPTP